MPFDFEHTLTLPSTACPGVTFTIAKPTVGRRIKLQSLAAAPLKEVEKLSAKFRKLIIKDSSPGAVTDEEAGNELLSAIAVVEETVLTPTYVKWGWLSVEGLTISGVGEITAESLIECGPPELVREIADEIRINLGLPPTQQKNSQPPTTSEEAAGGNPKSTIATTANLSDSTVSDIAHATPI